MYRVQGRVKKVEFDKTVRGAFGAEPALVVQVEAQPGSDYTDWVYCPDTPENRKALVPGSMFDQPVSVEIVSTKKGSFLKVTSPYYATAAAARS